MYKSYSLHNLDIKMLEYINFKNGTFIEAGANDGISQSNTYLYEKYLNWSGLLVEPNKKKFLDCKNNRSSIVENYALKSSKNNKTFLKGNFTSETYEESLTSMIIEDHDWVDTNILYNINEKQNKEIVEIQATTLNELLIKHNIKNIDFFSLDVEGYELNVLNGLDFEIYRPKYILIETANKFFYQEKIKNYMNEKGYKFLKSLSGNDDLFGDICLK